MQHAHTSTLKTQQTHSTHIHTAHTSTTNTPSPPAQSYTCITHTQHTCTGIPQVDTYRMHTQVTPSIHTPQTLHITRTCTHTDKLFFFFQNNPSQTPQNEFHILFWLAHLWPLLQRWHILEYLKQMHHLQFSMIQFMFVFILKVKTPPPPHVHTHAIQQTPIYEEGEIAQGRLSAPVLSQCHSDGRVPRRTSTPILFLLWASLSQLLPQQLSS